MKKIITLGLAILAVSMVAVIFYGCGKSAEDMTTTTQATTVETTMDIVTVPDKSDGKISDTAEENNGLIGDVVTGVSEGISEGLTDIKDAVE